MIHTPERIALVVDANSAHGRGVLEGVAEFARGHDPWVFMLPIGLATHMTDRLKDIACDGIIAHVRSTAMADAIRRLKRPTVNIADDIRINAFPRVSYAQETAGRLAAEHLIERGLEHYAFVGPRRLVYAERRLAGFRTRIDKARSRLHVYRDLSPDGDHTFAELTPLAWWLVSLPKPVGVFASDDERGCEVLQAAQLAPLSVPDELLVVGCGNDGLLANLATPSLSSVKLPSAQVGFEAGRLLQRLLQGGRAPADALQLEPVGVEARQSSELMAIDDPDVANALRFIRDNAHRPLQVGDVLDAVALSRRSLERRFQEHIGRSPQTEIQRVHVDRARTLLAETELPISEVAHNAGFRNADRLAAVFRRQVGLTPSDYRRQFRRR